MRKWLVLCLFMFSQVCHANYFCSGKVRHLSISNNGALWLGLGDEYQVINVCNISEDYCKAWLTLATTARIADKQIQLAFSNPSKNSSVNCPVNSAWGSPPDPIYDFNLMK